MVHSRHKERNLGFGSKPDWIALLAIWRARLRNVPVVIRQAGPGPYEEPDLGRPACHIVSCTWSSRSLNDEPDLGRPARHMASRTWSSAHQMASQTWAVLFTIWQAGPGPSRSPYGKLDLGRPARHTASSWIQLFDVLTSSTLVLFLKLFWESSLRVSILDVDFKMTVFDPNTILEVEV